VPASITPAAETVLVFALRLQASAMSRWAIQKPGVPRSRGGSATAICIFEARKTFTVVQAHWLAESPKGTPLHSKLQQTRHLLCCLSCYRQQHPLSGGSIAH